MTEREAIVAWLRERADDPHPFGMDHGDPIGSALSAAAIAIERGDYIKETEDDQ